MDKRLPTPAKRILLGENTVWAWVDEVSERCSNQPLTRMGSGFLEFNPPNFIIQAHQEALKNVDINQYGPLFGRHNFRKAIAAEYSAIFQRNIDANVEISISSGASEGMLSVLLAYVEPGDEVIVMEPCFNLYMYLIQRVGGTPKTVSLKPPRPGSKTTSQEWRLDPHDLEAAITPKTKFLMINTPHNPLGKVFTEDELTEIGGMCAKNNVLIISDEVYERITYTPGFPRLATLQPDLARITFTVFSVGKAFNATGWQLMGPVQVAHIFQTYVTAGPVQEAAVSGYAIANSTGFWADNKAMMKAKVDSFCEILEEIGLPYVEPDAAFFMWVDVSKVEVPSALRQSEETAGKPHDYQVCWLLMREFAIITIPGSGFYLDQSNPTAHTHLRFTVCKTDEEIDHVKTKLKGLKKYIRL